MRNHHVVHAGNGSGRFRLNGTCFIRRCLTGPARAQVTGNCCATGTVKLASCLDAAKIGAALELCRTGAPLPGQDRCPLRVAYHRLPLSFREVEELMLQRGVVVSNETIRTWCAKFGQAYAKPAAPAPSPARPGDKWYLDEVFIGINGQDPLPVARGRPARHRARHPGAVTPKRVGRQEVLP